MQVSTEVIIKLIIVVTTFFVIMAFFVMAYVQLYNQRKKKDAEEKKIMKDNFQTQLLRSQIEVQETTISSLARELHDNVGQLLSTTNMLLGITERKMTEVPDTYTVAQQTLGKAITELRSLSKSLDKEWLSQFDCIDNIRNEIARVNAANELQIHLEQTDKLPLSADKQIILFRIVQEAMQNSIKHADAKNIYISLGNTDNNIRVQVADDGKGMPQHNHQPGMGLNNMTQRARLLGGHIAWDSNPGHGTTTTITLPLIQTNEN
jgi:signal transduction histidine kinase